MVYGSKEFRKKKEKQKQAYLTLTERRAWLRDVGGASPRQPPGAGRPADHRGADGRVNREGRRRRRGLQLEASIDDSSAAVLLRASVFGFRLVASAVSVTPCPWIILFPLLCVLTDVRSQVRVCGHACGPAYHLVVVG